MKALKKFLFRQAERRLRQLPPLQRGPARFALHYRNKYLMGIGSYGLPLVHDWNEGGTLKIGAFCSIAENVQIFLGGHHRTDWISTYPFPAKIDALQDIKGYAFSRGDVVIGNDVWLGTGAMILSGITIGHGAVVGAGAVVTHDVDPYAVVAGNPAHLIKWRFDETTRKELLAVAWWEWPLEAILAAAPILCSDNIDALLEHAHHRESA